MESNWEVNATQKMASWEMYIELATRITTAELTREDVLLREALTSYYSLFATTREILKKSGPFIATPANLGDTTFGHIAVGVLNKVLRPILAKWHPILLDWEQRKISKISITEHELKWPHNTELRNELNQARLKLIEYANVLGEVSGVANLIDFDQNGR